MDDMPIEFGQKDETSFFNLLDSDIQKYPKRDILKINLILSLFVLFDEV